MCAIKSGELEMPSDILGVVLTAYDARGSWKRELAKELEAAGFDIDWDRVAR